MRHALSLASGNQRCGFDVQPHDDSMPPRLTMGRGAEPAVVVRMAAALDALGSAYDAQRRGSSSALMGLHIVRLKVTG